MQELKSIENMTFEDALKELEQIVRKLDSGQESLENAITSYERASKLKEYCEAKLQEAKFKIEKISKTPDGKITISDADI